MRGIRNSILSRVIVSACAFAAGPALARAPAQPPPVPTTGASCAQPDGHCISLIAVSIEGATVYTPAALASTYDQYLTRDVDVADLGRIADVITQRYRADGYFLSRAVAPAQMRGARIARLRVYEGYVGEVVITGDGSTAARKVLRPIEGKRPLRLADLQAALRLAADMPGLTVTSHLEPTPDDPAMHRLVVTATQKKVQVSAYIDNRGQHGAGPWQASMRAAVNSVIRAGDQFALAVLTVPDRVKEFTWGEASYSTPLGNGVRLRGSLGGSTSDGRPQGLATLIGGTSWEATLGLQKVWAIGRRIRVWAGLVADERHIERHWTPTYGYTDDVLALRGRLEATHVAPGQSSNVFAQLSAGQRGDLRADGSRFLSRNDADKEFWKVNAHAAHYQDIGRHVGVYAAVDGQWTPDRLMTSEGFAIGGAPYGRGYNYATLLGDRGVAGTVELRAGFSPKSKVITFVQGYTFVDAGKAWGSGPLDRSDAVASAGLGVRLRLAKQATLGFEAARRLNRTPADPKEGWRPSVYLSAEF